MGLVNFVGKTRCIQNLGWKIMWEIQSIYRMTVTEIDLRGKR